MLFLSFSLLACADQPPTDFVQIIPRGRLAAINNPEFVPAAKATIAADSWVLGVVSGQEARAYSLTLLNSHEVVNDTIDGKRIAAVW